MKCAPFASRTKTGKAPGDHTIQFIGTPPSRLFRARSKSSLERGCVAANRSRSCARRLFSRTRSMDTRGEYTNGVQPDASVSYLYAVKPVPSSDSLRQ